MMDQKELDAKWNETLKETFDRFIRENVGYKEGTPYPSCYGTGDGKPVCSVCAYKNSC
jgi:hypothetical protein